MRLSGPLQEVRASIVRCYIAEEASKDPRRSAAFGLHQRLRAKVKGAAGSATGLHTQGIYRAMDGHSNEGKDSFDLFLGLAAGSREPNSH